MRRTDPLAMSRQRPEVRKISGRSVVGGGEKLDNWLFFTVMTFSKCLHKSISRAQKGSRDDLVFSGSLNSDFPGDAFRIQRGFLETAHAPRNVQFLQQQNLQRWM